MLEKPDLENKKIVECLANEYGLKIDNIAFLPLGADLNTAVYRAIADDETPYFVKLRRGEFDEASVAVPKFLSELGIKHIIPALPTRSGQFWTRLASYKVILFPFVAGQNGFEIDLSDQQRVELGSALKEFHSAQIPTTITKYVPREAFSPRWREKVKQFLVRIGSKSYDDPITVELAAFLRNKRDETCELVKRAEDLASVLQTQTPEFILCHGDIHGWNLLVDASDNLYIVDWDTLIFAPKERDLMFVGSGLGGNGHTLKEEEILFYQGYGWTQINQTAMAYYRYERIIEDIAVICEHIFSSNGDGMDRRQSFEMLKSNFRSDGTIDIAYRIDRTRQ